MHLNHILIASDFSEHASYALQRAVDLAKRHSTALYFVHVLGQSWMANQMQLPVKDTQLKLLNAKQESEEKLLDLLSDFSLNRPYHVSVLTGRTSDEILRHAHENHCELIVVGAHGRYYINDYVFGTTSAAIVRQGDIPVLLIKKEPSFSYKSILIATDFSDASREAIEFAFHCFPEARFQLLHIVDIYYKQFLDDDVFKHSSSDTNSKTKDLWNKLDDFLKTCKVDTNQFDIKIIGGYTADAIVMQSEKWQADLLVFGTQGHSKLHYLLMGSVAKRLLQLSNIDMLAVPPKTP